MDALDLVPNKKIECLDKGFVELVDVMPRIVPDGQTCDYAICQMARTSYGQGTKTVNEEITAVIPCSKTLELILCELAFQDFFVMPALVSEKPMNTVRA